MSLKRFPPPLLLSLAHGLSLLLAVLSATNAHATPKPGERSTTEGLPDVPVDENVLRKRDWIWLPIPSASPSRGFGLAGLGALLYDLDEESQTSLTGLAAYGSTNGSWAVGGMQKVNFAKDRFRLDVAFGYADINYDYFGIGNEAGDIGLAIPIEQKGWAVRPRALVRVFSQLYVGVQYRYLTATTRLRLDLPDLPPDFPDIPRPELNVHAGLLGLLMQFDTRDNEWNPKKGLLFDAEFEFGRDKLGNDFSYESLRVTFSHYITLKPGHVLAYNLHTCSVWGSPPFFDLCLYGSSNTLRGYEAGRYRDYAMAAVQAEYRWQFHRKFGLAFFAGVGAVASNLGNLGKEGWLPSAGVGVRYLASEAFGINIGIDYARGKSSDALYIRIGEAF